MVTKLTGYSSTSDPTTHPVVHSVAKATLEDGREMLFIMSYSTLIEDDRQNESLCIPFEMMRHGISVDLTPKIHGETQCMHVKRVLIPFYYDMEK